MAPFKSGADRDRTGDLCSAIAALSQLSYSPEFGEVGMGGGVNANTDSPTYSLTHLLTYTPTPNMGATGLEPVTSTMST